VSDITQVALPTGQHTIRLEMFENDGDAYVGLWWEPAIITGWKGEYYNNETLSGNPAIIRDDPAVDFEWGYDSPDPMVLPDHFSARWTTIIPFDPGDYWFALFRDDGIRLKIDDAIALEAWYAGREWVSTVMNMPHWNHTIVVEAFEIDDLASAVFLFGQEINMTYLPLVIR
jgi:hypothetical protein